MQDMGIVYGSKGQAIDLVIGIDTVYVHSEIKKINSDPDGRPTDNLYKYKEIQYSIDEAIENEIITPSEFTEITGIEY